MRIVGIGVVLIVAACALASEANAFEKYGFKWPNTEPGQPTIVTLQICFPENINDVDRGGAKSTFATAADKWGYPDFFQFAFADDGCSSSGMFPLPNGVNQIDFGVTEQNAPGVTRPFFQGGDFLECDIRINSQLTWSFSSTGNIPDDQWDLLTAVLHELGHCLGLNDEPVVENAAMHNLLGPGETRRILDEDDIQGRAAIYDK